MNDHQTIQGLRILLGNATIQVQHLLDGMQVGAPDVHVTATTARKASELASLALTESEPVLRRLAPKARGK